jgi:hypothetical protein
MKPVDEITARRAVSGADADVLEAGGTPHQAEAVRVALKYWFLGDVERARSELGNAFPSGMVSQLLDEFAKGAAGRAA